MKGLVFTEIGKVSLQEVEKPILKDENDAIIKITTTTICGSDLHLIYGHIPTTPGYVLGLENVGLIDSDGRNVKNVKKFILHNVLMEEFMVVVWN